MSGPFQNLIAELDQQLLKEHRFDTSLFEKLTAIQHESGILHGDRSICPFLRPYFLAESRYNSIRRAAALLFGAFGSLTAAALKDDNIFAEFGISEKGILWARLDP